MALTKKESTREGSRMKAQDQKELMRERICDCAKRLFEREGYEQVSMRMFRLPKTGSPATPAVQYSCQEDGMIGLGAGARSYTQSVHYSSEYAVARHNIKSIIDQYSAKSNNDFSRADYGIVLSREEQQRRFIIKSLLHSSGLHLYRYQQLFGHEAIDAYPQLEQLIAHGMATRQGTSLYLTSTGIDHSDAIGPWLYSSAIEELIQNFTLQ